MKERERDRGENVYNIHVHVKAAVFVYSANGTMGVVVCVNRHHLYRGLRVIRHLCPISTTLITV